MDHIIWPNSFNWFKSWTIRNHTVLPHKDSWWNESNFWKFCNINHFIRLISNHSRLNRNSTDRKSFAYLLFHLAFPNQKDLIKERALCWFVVCRSTEAFTRLLEVLTWNYPMVLVAAIKLKDSVFFQLPNLRNPLRSRVVGDRSELLNPKFWYS